MCWSDWKWAKESLFCFHSMTDKYMSNETKSSDISLWIKVHEKSIDFLSKNLFNEQISWFAEYNIHSKWMNLCEKIEIKFCSSSQQNSSSSSLKLHNKIVIIHSLASKLSINYSSKSILCWWWIISGHPQICHWSGKLFLLFCLSYSCIIPLETKFLMRNSKLLQVVWKYWGGLSFGLRMLKSFRKICKFKFRLPRKLCLELLKIHKQISEFLRDNTNSS